MSKTTIVGVGTYANSELAVEPTHRALRASLRPTEFSTVGGAYSLSLASGVMAANLVAGSPIYAFQFPATQTGLIAMVKRVRFSAATDITAFAQGSVIIDLIRATKLPAQYTGGANVTITGKDQVRATRFAPNPLVALNAATGNVAIASTATLVAGAPAPTLDSNALHAFVGSVGVAPATIIAGPSTYLIDPTEAARQALELIAGEGFVIRATVPGTGTWKFAVDVDYEIVDPQRYYLA